MYNINFKDTPRDFVLLISYAMDNGFSNDDIIVCYNTLRKRGLKRRSLNQLKASQHAINESIYIDFPNNKTSQNKEIEDSSLDILQTLTVIMNNRSSNNNLTY